MTADIHNAHRPGDEQLERQENWPLNLFEGLRGSCSQSDPMIDGPLADALVSATALAEELGAARAAFTIEDTRAALESYLGGRSTRMAQRESGVPERVIENWVMLLGIKRTREQSALIKTQALASGRLLSAEVRRTVGAL